MRYITKLACATAIASSTLTASSPANAHHWHRYWAPHAYTYAPTYYYAAPPAYYYAPPAYDASGAIVAGMALGLMGAAIAASAASQPAYYYHGCNWYVCW